MRNTLSIESPQNMNNQPFIKSWARISESTRPFLFPGDEALLKDRSLVSICDSFDSFIKSSEFGDVKRNIAIHVNLLPQPYMGNLSKARVFILMANPGFGPDEYHSQEISTYYRLRLLENLRQHFHSTSYPFLFLDPQLSWHGGFKWWERKLRSLIDQIVQSREISYSEALRLLSKEIAVIDLVPYYSTQFGFDKNLHGRLASVNASRYFVHTTIVPRARSGNALIIITRGRRIWNLPSHKNIIRYTTGEARSASISLNTDGGIAIAKFLKIRVQNKL